MKTIVANWTDHVRLTPFGKVEKFSFATLLAARETGPAAPDTVPPAPTFESRTPFP